MAVSIRLRREGALNRPYYKVVVADSRSPRDGKFIEIIGTYDPKKTGHNGTLKMDRIEHWISKGAQPSDTVRSLIKKNRKQAASAPAEEPGPAAEAPAEEAPKAAE
jgi:small subunit ribosomal protein S16